MSRLIDADKLLENKFKNDISWNAFEKLIKRQPTVDAVPVVHGHWIMEDIPGTDWYRVICSECGENVTSVAPLYAETGCGFKYCPNCGAKMDEVTE